MPQSVSTGANHNHTKVRHLLVIEDVDGHRFVSLEASSYFLGRDPTNSIVLQAIGISRQHALLLRITNSDPNDYGFLLIDGNLQGQTSTNGITVNGEKCISSRLRHGDHIVFGCQVHARYLLLPALSDQDFQNYCQTLSETQDYDEFLTEVTNPKETVCQNIAESNHSAATSLVRLASFPEIIPSPMVEINLFGELTYLNPAAIHTFSDLPTKGMQHPIMQGLLNSIKEQRRRIFSREVAVGGKVFEQSIHYISENGLVRSCLFDITERKQAEAELLKRDRLMHSVTQATAHLLANESYDFAITKALETFGAAAGVDRISISQNQLRSESCHLETSIRFEWVSTSIEPIRSKLHRQQQPYSSPHLKRWYSILSTGTAIRGSLKELPEAEQLALAQDGILSILVVPIMVHNDFWGFVEIDSCTTEYYWSEQEESFLRSFASSVSAALQRQSKDEIIQHQAFHDSLTGLPNRLLFTERLNQALVEAQQTHQNVAVMFLDLDRFKKINDTLGHSVGDELLKEVAHRLKISLRAGDTVARWGGDEFTVLLTQIQTIEDAAITARRILSEFTKVICIGRHELYANTSIGIAFYPNDGEEAELLLQHADVALYQSKEQGRGHYQFYNPGMNSQAPELFVLQNELRHALNRNELQLHYQPQVNLKSGIMIGAEALLRWQHSEQGFVSPATFIPLAEESGQIIEIGEWVLRSACHQAKAWHHAGLTLSVAVNVSACQFYESKLVDTVAEILAETQLDPKYLELEITETTAIKDINFTQTVLHQLQEMGVRIAMDDFGTGYSSLNYITQLSLDILKIDQSFVRNLRPDAKEVEIISAVLALGRGLNLTIIAEGVDSQEQLELLRTLECEIVQGYLLSHPLSVEAATAKLKANWNQKCALSQPHQPQSLAMMNARVA